MLPIFFLNLRKGLMWILFNDVFRNVRMGQTGFLNTVR